MIRKRTRSAALTALAVVAGAAFVVSQSTAVGGDGTTPLPVASASANPVVVCEPASIAADGSFTLPCFGPALPTPETTTVTVTTPVPVPTTVTHTVTVTAAPTTPPPTTTTPPATTPPPATTRPGAANTGVPDGTVLTAYTSPCVIRTAGTTLVARRITCPTLEIRAANVVIRDSLIITTTRYSASVGVYSGSLTITDSTIQVPLSTSGIDGSHFVATRLDISGGNRGAWCSHCTIQDSWIHGGRATGGDHASGLRAEVESRFLRNTVTCDIAGDYCSADLTGYPDNQAVHDWLIEGNFFGATSGYFCAYGGATSGKPYSSATDNATNIVFRGNVFARGPARVCGRSGGTPITDFAKGRTGNIWSDNRYEDGALINV